MCAPTATVVGYMGGTGDYPSYDTNYSKLNYTETIRVIYDAEALPFEKVPLSQVRIFCPNVHC